MARSDHFPKHLLKGIKAEKAALNFLKQQGLKFITKNYLTKLGEIDLIMKDHDSICFIEVRYRKQNKHGLAVESVNHKKKQRIIKTAYHFLQNSPSHQKLTCRFDIVGMTTYNGELQFNWYKSAFCISELREPYGSY